MDIFLGLSEIFHPDSVAVILRRDSALITKHLPVAPVLLIGGIVPNRDRRNRATL
jgi:hypothetical protein